VKLPPIVRQPYSIKATGSSQPPDNGSGETDRNQRRQPGSVAAQASILTRDDEVHRRQHPDGVVKCVAQNAIPKTPLHASKGEANARKKLRQDQNQHQWIKTIKAIKICKVNKRKYAAGYPNRDFATQPAFEKPKRPPEDKFLHERGDDNRDDGIENWSTMAVWIIFHKFWENMMAGSRGDEGPNRERNACRDHA
jgi:hypothetical protein